MNLRTAMAFCSKRIWFVLLCFSCSGATAQLAAVRVVTGTDGLGTLAFPDGSAFQTTLYHLKVIGQLKTTQKKAFYVLSGVGCRECDANTSIYIHSPSDGPMKDEASQARFFYPGHITDIETGRTIYDSRAFWGDCVSGHSNGVVWFEKFVGEDRAWHSRVVVAEIKADNLVTQTLSSHSVKIGEATQSVLRGTCKEIPGMTRQSEP